MTVIEKNSGTKIPYEVVKNKICFDDDLTINLAKREDDRDVHIDVCYDSLYPIPGQCRAIFSHW